jgi:geranylgeranyl pyrophosphate synthase
MATPEPDIAATLAYPVSSADASELREAIDAYLGGLWLDAEGPAEMVTAMRDVVLSGGKRVRPVLAMATAELLGHDPLEVLPLAAAIELIHVYSLVHDDLPAMDDNHTRRGQPTCHRRYGEGIAILIGDALFAEAIRLVVRQQRGDAQRIVAALEVMLALVSIEGVAGGQYLDLTDAATIDPELLEVVGLRKTGGLFRAAVRSVAVWADASPQHVDALDRYASAVGLLFQVRDDQLDVSGEAELTGKPLGADARNGRYTHASPSGAEGAVLLVDRLRRDAATALSVFDQMPAKLVALADFAGRRDR